ncbi:MAG TPA: ester cyclase [Acidimicrobiia bacterium]|nr:ester cyclase [Acidimicrobiia bacterium]
MGYAKDLIDRSTKAWNAHDFGEWSATFTEDAQLAGPGGLSGRGRDTQQMFYSIWQDGFPDNQVSNIRIAEDGDSAVLEAVFEGTHTGVLKAPSGDIPPTGKQVSIPFVVTYTCADGLLTGFRLYFDQMDLITQLGLGGT